MTLVPDILAADDGDLGGLIYLVAVIVLSVIGYAVDAIKKASERQKEAQRRRSFEEPISPIEPQAPARPLRPVPPPVARSEQPRPSPPMQRPLPAGGERPRPPVRPPQAPQSGPRPMQPGQRPPGQPVRPVAPQPLRQPMAQRAARHPAQPAAASRPPAPPEQISTAASAPQPQQVPAAAPAARRTAKPVPTADSLSAKDFSSLNGADLRKAIVLNEILSPPLALRDSGF